MSKYSTLKAEIIASIKRNGAQAITGDLLQEKLLSMIDSLGEHYQFGGLALPSTGFTAGDEPVVFIAATPGTYTDFGGLVVADGEVALLVWDGSTWSKQTTDIATRTEVSQLGQEVDELHAIDDIVNLSLFAEDSSNFVTLNGNVLTITATDNRSESNLHYRVHLNAGTYYMAFDNISTSNFYVQLYDPVKSLLVNVTPKSNVSEKRSFTIATDGDYTIKIAAGSDNEYPFTVSNFNLYSQDSKDYILPNFDDGSTDDEAISKALRIAWGSGIATVLVPAKDGEYILHNSIVARSGVRLVLDRTTRLKLADAVNLPMVINAYISTTSTHYEHDICIDGGIWDGNRSGQDKYNFNYGSEPVVGMAFVGVDKITICNAAITNARTYGIIFSNCNDVEIFDSDVSVGDVSNEDNADGIHVLGPSVNVNIHNCKVKSEDNCIAINANDVDHGTRYSSQGHIVNVDINNIFLNNSKGQGILLLSTSYKLQNTSIHSVRGTTGYFLNISNFGLSSGSGHYQGINVYDIEVTIDGGQEDCIRVCGDIDSVNFRDIYMRTNWDNVWQRKFLKIYTINTNTCNIENISLENITINGSELTSKPLYLITQDAGNIKNLYINGFISLGNKCPTYFLKCNGYIVYTTITNCQLTNLYNGLCWIDEYGVMDNIKIDNIVLDSVSAPRICNPYNKVISFASVSKMLDFEVDASQFIFNRQNDLNGNALTWYKQGELIFHGRIISLCTNSGSLYNNELQPNTPVSVGGKFTNQNNIIVCVYAGTTGDDVSEISTTETGLILSGSAQFIMYHKGKATFTEGEW